MRFTDSLLKEGIETHVIEGVSVKVFGVARTVADCFRHRGKLGRSVAIEGRQEALRQRKATPAEIARQAEKGGVSTVVRPSLEALKIVDPVVDPFERLSRQSFSPHNSHS